MSRQRRKHRCYRMLHSDSTVAAFGLLTVEPPPPAGDRHTSMAAGRGKHAPDLLALDVGERGGGGGGRPGAKLLHDVGAAHGAGGSAGGLIKGVLGAGGRLPQARSDVLLATPCGKLER